jgi:hypothetical protein
MREVVVQQDKRAQNAGYRKFIISSNPSMHSLCLAVILKRFFELLRRSTFRWEDANWWNLKGSALSEDDLERACWWHHGVICIVPALEGVSNWKTRMKYYCLWSVSFLYAKGKQFEKSKIFLFRSSERPNVREVAELREAGRGCLRCCCMGTDSCSSRILRTDHTIPYRTLTLNDLFEDTPTATLHTIPPYVEWK